MRGLCSLTIYYDGGVRVFAGVSAVVGPVVFLPESKNGQLRTE